MPLVQVLVLWIAGLGAAMQFAKISVMFPHLLALYPDAGPKLGLLVSIIGFLGIGLGLFAGLIVARFGYRKLLIYALCLGAASSIFQAILPAFEVMLLSRLVEGASHLVIVVAAPTLIAQRSSDQYRGMAMTLWSTFFGVAFALVAWIGIPLVESYGLSALFIGHAFWLLLIAATLAIILPADRIAKEYDLKLSPKMFFREHIRAYSSPFIAAPAVGWLFYTLTFVSLLTILPSLVPAANRNFVAGAMPIASIIVSMVCGVFILPRLSAINTVILGFALGICVMFYLGTTPDKTWASIALFGVLGLVQSASFAAIPRLNKSTEAQARANGAMAQMGNLGNTIGTPILLIVLTVFGDEGAVFGVVVCYCSAIATHLFFRRRRQKTGI